MSELVLLLQLTSALALVGLIWFVQVVHYPLFDQVGRANFAHYEKDHQRRTTWIVAPLMLTEALTALLLLWHVPVGVADWSAWLGLSLVIMVLASTFFWQVPAHRVLAVAYDSEAHRRLVRSNWFRTAVWTSRGLLICVIAI